MKPILTKLFSLYTAMMALLTGIVVGSIISDKIFESHWQDWYTPGVSPGNHTVVIIIFWLGSLWAKGYTTLLTFWLLLGALIKKIKWKWAVLGGGIWWVLYGIVGVSMHALS